MIDEMLHRCLLEAIDLREDVRQRGGVGCAEVTAARRTRDLAEQLLVDLHRHRLIPESERPLPSRYWCLALGPDTDRVDLDAERRGCLCRRARIHRALVVFPVGEQNHDLALAESTAQADSAPGDLRADPRAILQDYHPELAGRLLQHLVLRRDSRPY